jgi:isopenicillin-N N-acyltransferase like protein
MTRTFTSSPLEPAERGYEFGRALAGPVESTVDAYLGLFAERGGPAALVESLGAAALDRIEAWAPELAAEIRGIAAGSGVPVARLAAINARTEVLAHLGRTGHGECSTVVGHGATPAGSVAPTGIVAATDIVAMQNWDWYASMSGNWLAWTIPHPDGRRVTTVTEYGIVGKIGVNSLGVGTLFNILHHELDGDGMGLPVHVVARRILDTAASVEDGLWLCSSAQQSGFSASTSITIVDSDRAVAAELWPGGLGQVPSGPDGLLMRTNHFLSAPARDGDRWTDHGEDTVARLDELRRRLRGQVSTADVRDALADHGSGLCCHPGPGEPHATLATVALDVPGRTLRVTAGQPCLPASADRDETPTGR